MNKKIIFIFFQEHYLAIIMAVIVGLIYIAPNLFFIGSLGGRYRGIPIMQTANEDLYIARIQEILDGHPGLGAFAFYEGKDQLSFTPPVGEMFYAVPAMLLHWSAVKAVIASRFFLPLILFLLIYFLILRLTANFTSGVCNKINAIAGALLVTLGYDLVDIKTAWLFLTGKISGGYFLLWSRPVNPVIGGTLLFAFLLCVCFIIGPERHHKRLIVVAGALMALMMGVYFFSWGLALAVLFFLSLGYLIEKKYYLLKKFALILAAAAIFSAPYWYNSWQISRSPWYQDALLRNGFFYTHYSLWNKLLIAALFFYAAVLFILWLKRKTWPLWRQRVMTEGAKAGWQNWLIFCLALLLGGLVSLNQQILTGRTVWPYHFIQYTIPFAMVAVCVLLYNVMAPKWPKVWRALVIIFIISVLGWGIFTQARVYGSYFDYYVSLQSYQPTFDWLNRQPKDCVVLVLDETGGQYNLNGLIPAFTHCNIYASTWGYNLLSPERLRWSYPVWLRLKGVTAEGVEDYLQQNRQEAAGYLFSSWKTIFGLKQFPDFSDPQYEERLAQFPAQYRQFLQEDFRTELSRYRLDYIVSVGPLPAAAMAQLPGLKLIWQENNIFIYSFAS